MAFKSVIITGASDGIGFELCLLFAKNGSKIYANGRSISKLERLKNACASMNAEIEIFSCDVRNREAMVDWIDSVFAKDKEVDLVFANAGVLKSIDSQDGDFMVLDINVIGVANTILPAIKHLKKRDYKSRIAITGSIAGYCVIPDSYSYSSSKVFCNALAQGLYLNLKKHSINVSIINPGFINTQMIQGLPYKPLFALSAHKAANMIYDGLIHGKRVVSFPALLVFLAKLYHFIPMRLKPLFSHFLPKGL